jgi:hypothetical protein
MAEVQERLRMAFGREVQYEHLWRWPVPADGSRLLDVWLDTSWMRCEVWISEPGDDVPCCCEIETGRALESLIERIGRVVKDGRTPPRRRLAAELSGRDGAGQLLRWRAARASGP